MGGDDNADAAPVFHSRLRAKREERMQQRQQELVLTRSAGSHGNFDMRGGPDSSSPGKDSDAWGQANVHRPIVAESGEDAFKRRERAEARKCVIEYHGAPMLLRRRHPDAEQGGRTLLHCAAWHGYKAIVELILATGCDVDVVDSVASKTTALIEAARAGHADVCVILLHHGAALRHRDSYGDTAFHWAARQGHGTVLLQMALEQERLEPGSTPALWVMKNYKSRTVVDFVQAHTFVVPLLQKRLGNSFTRALESAKGKRRSRFPIRAAVLGTRKSTQASSRPEQGLNDGGAQGVEPIEHVVTSLSGVDALGLDISSFAYKQV